MATERITSRRIRVNFPVHQELVVNLVSFLEQQSDRVTCRVLRVVSWCIIGHCSQKHSILHYFHTSWGRVCVEEHNIEVVHSSNWCCKDTWRQDFSYNWAAEEKDFILLMKKCLDNFNNCHGISKTAFSFCLTLIDCSYPLAFGMKLRIWGGGWPHFLFKGSNTCSLFVVIL